MKVTIVSKVSSAIVLAVALAVASLTAQAQVISWSEDVWGFSGTTGGNGLPVNLPAGVVLAYNWNDTWQENYNNVQSTGVTVNNLYDNSGAATAASITYAADNGADHVSYTIGADADGSHNREMLNGYLNSGPATWGPPITYSYTTFNAIPYSSYNVYVYFGSDTAARPGTVTDGTTTYDFSTLGQAAISGANALFTQTTDTTGANPAADYAIFTGETASSLTITCTPTDLSPTDAEWLGISAIQIVAVPEPGTLAMAALGGIGMLVFGRRFKARR